MTTTAHLAFVPRDGFFCKDGKDWHTSESGRGHGLDWPWPSTLLGATRTAWGRAEELRSGTHFQREDWPARTAPIQLARSLVLRRCHGLGWSNIHTVWPVPCDALWLKERSAVLRLEPEESQVPTLGRDDDEARELLRWAVLEDAAKPLTPPRWWSREEFVSWLAGQSVLARCDRKKLGTMRRLQAHVGIAPDTQTAHDGALFSHDVVETLERDCEWAMGLEVILPDGALPSVAMLGSDSRLMSVEVLPRKLFDIPDEVVRAFESGITGLRLLTVTPASFKRGWLPDGLERRDGAYRGSVGGLQHEVILRAAFVPRPVHVSGWDMVARSPKPTSRMVAPGAVYFFERADGKSFDAADARAMWLAALGQRTEEGFGRVVPGIWNPKRSSR